MGSVRPRIAIRSHQIPGPSCVWLSFNDDCLARRTDHLYGLVGQLGKCHREDLGLSKLVILLSADPTSRTEYAVVDTYKENIR